MWAFPLDRAQLKGSVSYQNKSYDFSSQEFALETEEINAERLFASNLEIPVNWIDGSGFSMSLTLTNELGERRHNFLLGDLAAREGSSHYKRLSLDSPEKLAQLGNSKLRRFDACEMEHDRKDRFHFEFEGGDTVAFTTSSKLLGLTKQTQSGRVLQATGSYAGQAFEVEVCEDLVYCNPNFASRYRRPHLAVRFPEKDGICGLGLRPSRDPMDEQRYTAELLDCDLKTTRKLPIVSMEVPKDFGAGF